MKGIKRKGRSNGVPRAIAELLEAEGFKLKRATHHFVFTREADGATIVVSVSPRAPSSEIAYVRQDIRRANRARDMKAAS